VRDNSRASQRTALANNRHRVLVLHQLGKGLGEEGDVRLVVGGGDAQIRPRAARVGVTARPTSGTCRAVALGAERGAHGCG
jgi:hypothetical protein